MGERHKAAAQLILYVRRNKMKNKLKINQTVIVKAIWRKNILTRCRIINIWTSELANTIYVNVRPLEGHPHMQTCRIDDILIIEPDAVEPPKTAAV